MRKPSIGFEMEVRAEWGSPHQVALVACQETFSHEHRFNVEEHDQIVDTAVKVGILVGQSVTADDFIDRFTNFLNEDQSMGKTFYGEDERTSAADIKEDFRVSINKLNPAELDRLVSPMVGF